MTHRKQRVEAPVPDAPVPEKKAAGFTVAIKQEAALGHGTRPPGFVLGRIVPSATVALDEILTALANQHLIVIEDDADAARRNGG